MGASCVRKAEINICSLVSSLDVPAKIQKCGAIQWCKWDAAATACVKKTPVEVDDTELAKTEAPTLAPTLAPTDAPQPPVDTCRICVHNELFSAMMASASCFTYVERASRSPPVAPRSFRISLRAALLYSESLTHHRINSIQFNSIQFNSIPPLLPRLSLSLPSCTATRRRTTALTTRRHRSRMRRRRIRCAPTTRSR